MKHIKTIGLFSQDWVQKLWSIALVCFLAYLAIAIAFFPASALALNSDSRALYRANLIGAIDFHVHSSPDVVSRSVDDFELAKMAVNAGMKAVVLKNHVTTTADRAVLVSKIVPGIEIFGGIVLNHAVGGLNSDAVEAMVRMSGDRGKVVWLPTIDADYHLKVFNKSGIGIKVAENDRILPETEVILQAIARHHLVLSTGHISPEEVLLVIRRARELGVKNIVVTHAMADVPGLSLKMMQKCADLGAFLELDFVNDLMGKNAIAEGHRQWHRVSVQKMAQTIRAIGAEHFILSTDLGRQGDPLPAEGYQLFVDQLIDEGISQPEIAIMLRENPARLLGLS